MLQFSFAVSSKFNSYLLSNKVFQKLKNNTFTTFTLFNLFDNSYLLSTFLLMMTTSLINSSRIFFILILIVENCFAINFYSSNSYLQKKRRNSTKNQFLWLHTFLLLYCNPQEIKINYTIESKLGFLW